MVAFNKKVLEVNPNTTCLNRQITTSGLISLMSVNHKKRTKSLCSLFRQICKKACFMPVTKSYLPIRNRTRISFNNGSKQGPVSKLPRLSHF